MQIFKTFWTNALYDNGDRGSTGYKAGHANLTCRSINESKFSLAQQTALSVGYSPTRFCNQLADSFCQRLEIGFFTFTFYTHASSSSSSFSLSSSITSLLYHSTLKTYLFHNKTPSNHQTCFHRPPQWFYGHHDYFQDLFCSTVLVFLASWVCCRTSVRLSCFWRLSNARQIAAIFILQRTSSTTRRGGNAMQSTSTSQWTRTSRRGLSNFLQRTCVCRQRHWSPTVGYAVTSRNRRGVVAVALSSSATCTVVRWRRVGVAYTSAIYQFFICNQLSTSDWPFPDLAGGWAASVWRVSLPRGKQTALSAAHISSDVGDAPTEALLAINIAQPASYKYKKLSWRKETVRLLRGSVLAKYNWK